MALVNTVLLANTPPYLHLALSLSGPACSYCLWVKASVWNTGQDAGSYCEVGTPPSPSDGFGFEKHGVGGANYFEAGNHVSGPEPDYTTPGLSYTGWIWFAFVLDGSGNLTTYAATETSPPVVLTTGTITGTPNNLYLHNPFGSSPDAHAKYSSIKFWSTNLSNLEIVKEWTQHAPVRTSNILTYLSGDNGSTIGTDQSGQGNNWTQVSTGFTTDTDIPILGARVLQSIGAVGAATGTTLAATLPTAVTIGSTLHVFASNKDTSGATMTCADGVNGSYGAAIDTPNDATNLQQSAQFSFKNSAAGSVTTTITYSITSTLRTIEVLEIVGVETVAPLDGHTAQVQASPGSGTDAISSGNASNSKQAALIVALSMDNRTVSPVAPAAGTGFTDLGAVWNLASGNQARVESQRITTATAIAATFTGTAGVAPTTLMAIYDEIGAIAAGTAIPTYNSYTTA